MPALHIRPARAGESDLLTGLAQRSKAHWGYPAEWLREWATELTIDPATIAHGIVRVAERNGRIAGFHVVEARGTTCDLLHFWVEPGCMGQGIGRALFADVVREAGRLDCREIRIESDPNAEPFYRRLGAIPEGQVPAPVAGAERWLPLLTFRTAAAC